MSIYIPKAIVYKITHIPTGRYYIGKTIQVQEFINEEYNGSGTVWDNIYNAHPPEEFQRKILKEFDVPTIEESEDMAYEYEGQIVTLELIENDPLCINKIECGRGVSSANNPMKNPITQQKQRDMWTKEMRLERSINNPSRRPEIQQKQRDGWTPELRQSQSNRMFGDSNPMKNPESRNKISKSWTKERRQKAAKRILIVHEISKNKPDVFCQYCNKKYRIKGYLIKHERTCHSKK